MITIVRLHDPRGSQYSSKIRTGTLPFCIDSTISSTYSCKCTTANISKTTMITSIALTYPSGTSWNPTTIVFGIYKSIPSTYSSKCTSNNYWRKRFYWCYCYRGWCCGCWYCYWRYYYWCYGAIFKCCNTHIECSKLTLHISFCYHDITRITINSYVLHSYFSRNIQFCTWCTCSNANISSSIEYIIWTYEVFYTFAFLFSIVCSTKTRNNGITSTSGILDHSIKINTKYSIITRICDHWNEWNSSKTSIEEVFDFGRKHRFKSYEYYDSIIYKIYMSNNEIVL